MEWLLVILIRLVLPLTILRWPLFGSVLATICDNLDVIILDFLGVKEFGSYNKVDKSLDIYYHLIQGYTLISWKNIIAKRIGIFLLALRLSGALIYEVTNIRFLLFIFPNVFEFYFLYYLIYKKFFKREPFTKFIYALPMLFILTILKLSQEYMLHISQFPIYGLIKDKFLFFLF